MLLVSFDRNHFIPMLVQIITQSRVQYFQQPLGLYSYPTFFYDTLCIMTAWLGRAMRVLSIAGAGVGVSRRPWCLSGDTLELDRGLSCLHHHLFAEIQIITCVLMWVVVLICSQSRWSIRESLPLLMALLISSRIKRGNELINEMN